MSSETFSFAAILQAHARGGSFCVVPQPVTAALGTRGQVRLRGTLNGQPFASSLAPMGDGQHTLLVHKATREALGLATGDTLEIVFTRDTAERTVEVPAELTAALAAAPAAGATFAGLAYTHRKEFAGWVATAKKPETRTRRAAQAVEMLRAGQKIS